MSAAVRLRPRPHPRWGHGLDYLLAACLAATGAASVAGQFPAGYAVSAAFAIGFAASAFWRLIRGDPRRIGLQLLAVLAWLGWFRVYWLWVVGAVEGRALRAVGVAFLLGGLALVAWLRRTPPGRPRPAGRQ